MQSKAILVLLGLLFAVGAYSIYTKGVHRAEVSKIWNELAQSETGGTFKKEMLEGLPPAAQKYLSHAIKEGTPLAGSVTLKMEGHMRLDPNSKWLPMEADQIISVPRGFVWQARVGEGGLDFTGGDHYFKGKGNVRFWLSNFIPIVNAKGPDIARSAEGRLAFESIWHPSSLLPGSGTAWEGIDDRRAKATITVYGTPHEITVEVDESGRLKKVYGRRWGDHNETKTWESLPFGAEVFEEEVFDGYTLPSRVTVSWNVGKENEFAFFRASITEAGAGQRGK